MGIAALAGSASLAYEVAWLHGLSLAVGSHPRAQAVVVGCFLLGMAAGSVIGGHGCWSRFRPTRLLGVAEGLLGLLGWLVPEALTAAPGWVGTLVRDAGIPATAARALVTVPLIGVPALIMGFTYPAWVRCLVATGLRPTSAAAWVSGVQVLGAAVGAAVAGFVSVPAVGFLATSNGAGVLGLVLAGMLALGLPGAAAGRRTSPDPGSSPSPALASSPGLPSSRRFNTAFFLCGFVSLGYQVVWTRGLVFFCDGFHFAFAGALVAYLAGIALGSLWVAVWGPRLRDPWPWLGRARVLAAALSLGALVALPQVSPFAAEAARSSDGFDLPVLWLSLGILLLPATALGTTLPLAVWMRLERPGPYSRAVGRAYGLITFGNAVGALLVPLFWIPWFSLRTTWVFLAALDLVAALVLARTRAGRWALATVAGLLMALGISVDRWTDPWILHSRVFTSSLGAERDLVASVDGPAATVSVVRDLGRGSTVLYTDTFAAAATGQEYPYMRLLGHLPIALAKEPRRAMVACFGTGTTAAAVAAHPSVQSLRLVDVEPEVFAAAHHFREVNRGVLDGRPGLDLQVVTEDGRFDLLVSDRRFDVITLEPLMPYTTGAAPLYTREFYRLARSRLADGGVLCQWIPVHAIPVQDYGSLVRTFLDVFPQGQLFFFEQSSLLVGKADSGPIPFETFAARCAESAVAKDLNAALVTGPEDLLAAWVAGGEVLAEVFSDAPIMEDAWPFVALRRTRPEAQPRAPLADTLERLLMAAERSEEGTPGWQSWVEPPDPFPPTLRLLMGVRRDLLRGRALEARAYERGAATGDPADFGPALLAYGDGLLLAPDHPEARLLRHRLAYSLERGQVVAALRSGRPVEARARLLRFRGGPAFDASGEALLAGCLLVLGDEEAAVSAAQRILAGHPRQNLARAVLWRGTALLGSGSSGPPSGIERELLFIDEARSAYGASTRGSIRDLRAQVLAHSGPEVLESPGALRRLGDQAGRDSAVISLLRASLARDLRAEDVTDRPALWRAAAALDVQELLDLLSQRPLDQCSVEERRILAALVPADEATFRALAQDSDVVVRRLLTGFARDRGARPMAPWLLPALEDDDEDVRLFADLALRQLSGRNAGFDYLGSAEERAAGRERWRALLE